MHSSWTLIIPSQEQSLWSNRWLLLFSRLFLELRPHFSPGLCSLRTTLSLRPSLLSARLNAPSSRRWRAKLVWCPHCNQMLAPKTSRGFIIGHKRRPGFVTIVIRKLWYLLRTINWTCRSYMVVECCSRDTASIIPLADHYQMNCKDTEVTEPEDSSVNLSVESSSSK